MDGDTILSRPRSDVDSVSFLIGLWWTSDDYGLCNALLCTVTLDTRNTEGISIQLFPSFVFDKGYARWRGDGVHVLDPVTYVFSRLLTPGDSFILSIPESRT